MQYFVSCFLFLFPPLWIIYYIYVRIIMIVMVGKKFMSLASASCLFEEDALKFSRKVFSQNQKILFKECRMACIITVISAWIEYRRNDLSKRKRKYGIRKVEFQKHLDKADDFALSFYTCKVLVYLTDMEIQVNFRISFPLIIFVVVRRMQFTLGFRLMEWLLTSLLILQYWVA